MDCRVWGSAVAPSRWMTARDGNRRSVSAGSAFQAIGCSGACSPKRKDQVNVRESVLHCSPF